MYLLKDSSRPISRIRRIETSVGGRVQREYSPSRPISRIRRIETTSSTSRPKAAICFQAYIQNKKDWNTSRTISRVGMWPSFQAYIQNKKDWNGFVMGFGFKVSKNFQAYIQNKKDWNENVSDQRYQSQIPSRPISRIRRIETMYAIQLLPVLA